LLVLKNKHLLVVLVLELERLLWIMLLMLKYNL
jgi:hypothetical protein